MENELEDNVSAKIIGAGVRSMALGIQELGQDELVKQSIIGETTGLNLDLRFCISMTLLEDLKAKADLSPTNRAIIGDLKFVVGTYVSGGVLTERHQYQVITLAGRLAPESHRIIIPEGVVPDPFFEDRQPDRAAGRQVKIEQAVPGEEAYLYITKDLIERLLYHAAESSMRMAVVNNVKIGTRVFKRDDGSLYTVCNIAGLLPIAYEA